jgi:hypothetical protein
LLRVRARTIESAETESRGIPYGVERTAGLYLRVAARIVR